MDCSTTKLVLAAALGAGAGILGCHLVCAHTHGRCPFSASCCSKAKASCCARDERKSNTDTNTDTDPSCAAAGDEAQSNPDQPARFAQHKADGVVRVMDIDAVFEPSSYSGRRVLVTGSNRGLGLALVQQAAACGATVYATCRRPSEALAAVGGDVRIIEGVDVTKDAAMATLVAGVDAPLDVVINNAGYFYGPTERLESLAFDEELKMIDICAVGMLRVTAALWNAKKITPGGKVAMITSQGGSISWREVQNPAGGDYGHHMSKAAANMMGKLVAQELKGQVAVAILHPGFCRTDMTNKYADIYDEHGAVESSIGAKRVLHQINLTALKDNAKLVNCEDGLTIPW